MKVIKLPISIDYLEERLGMPIDMHIVGSVSFDAGRQLLTLLVESPYFADVTPPEPVPEVSPTLTRHEPRIAWRLGDVALGDARRMFGIGT